MVKNIQLVTRHSQIQELANLLKFDIIRELISSEATCQQIADILNVSKQKIHYNLNKLLEEDLIETVEDVSTNGKEVYYRAKAKNYVLDFALGEHVKESTVNGRNVIQNIIEREYKLPLSAIASKILKESLKLKARQKLLIVTGKYNLPLVEKILLEAGRINIRTTLIYQDVEILKAKYEEYSLSAFNSDYKYFNQLLKSHHVYLNLNGEARHIQINDPEKAKLRSEHFTESLKIINDKKVKVAMMPGLLDDTLSNKAIDSELQFWKALDVDYSKLSKDTLSMCAKYRNTNIIKVCGNNSNLQFRAQTVYAETGSFSDNPYQCPTINYPGGEVLIVPAERTMNGIIQGDVAYAFGQKILNPVIHIQNNEVISFSAEQNEELLYKALEQGGEDGYKVALATIGTNPNVSLANIDLSFKQKSQGLLSLYWGDNRMLGGKVAGKFEWILQIDNPELTTN